MSGAFASQLATADEAGGKGVGEGGGGGAADGVEGGHGGAGGDGGGGVLAHGAVRGHQGRGNEAIGAAHDGHGHAALGGVHEPGLVRLPQHTVHRRRQVVEPELHVQVREAVVVADAVAVRQALRAADGDHVQRHSHLLPDGEVHGVGGADAVEGEHAVGRRPRRAVQGEGAAVVGEAQLVRGGFPLGDAVGGDGEGVGAEDEAERLHPREVASAAWRALADEVGVDVEVGVGDEAEVLVHAPVEVEGHAVPAHNLGVSADATLQLAYNCHIHMGSYLHRICGYVRRVHVVRY